MAVQILRPDMQSRETNCFCLWEMRKGDTVCLAILPKSGYMDCITVFRND